MDTIKKLRSEYGMGWLNGILAERLKHNRTWTIVEVEEGKRKFSIIWSGPKNPTDLSKSREVKPYNTHTLTQMINIQEAKLKDDIAMTKLKQKDG